LTRILESGRNSESNPFLHTCTQCGGKGAEYVVIHNDRLHILCEVCFHEIKSKVGEENLLDFQVSIAGEAVDAFIYYVNKMLVKAESTHTKLLNSYDSLRLSLSSRRRKD